MGWGSEGIGGENLRYYRDKLSDCMGKVKGIWQFVQVQSLAGIGGDWHWRYGVAGERGEAKRQSPDSEKATLIGGVGELV